MALKNSNIPSWNENHTSLDNLIFQISQISENGEVDSSNLESNSSVRSALSNFYNDIKVYKEAVNEIKKVQSKAANVQRLQNERVFCNQNQIIDSFAAKKYSLFQYDKLSMKQSVEVNRKIRPRSWKKTPSEILKKSASDVTVISHSNHSSSTLNVKHKKSKKSIIKLEPSKTVLIAEPSVVEFLNCEVHKNYKKTVALHNVDTQLARFEIESRPSRSAFDVFVESGTGEKRNVAPGMLIRIVVIYKCLSTNEPEETLVIRVRDGKPVFIKLRVSRDPPKLEVLLQTFTSSFVSKRISKSVASSTDLEFTSFSSSSSFEKTYPMSDIFTESTSDSYSPKTRHLNFDCKKCFVGEFVYVATIFKNIAGKGRFFIMNEIDWCFMNIEDVTRKNSLIIAPFAIWPVYFVLRPNEQITLYTYFFPNSPGLQVDELYFISDNGAVKTFEIIGDGIMFEPQLLQFDKKVKYQWFKEKRQKFHTIRYLDIGSSISGEDLSTSFTFTNKCELNLHYRWEISQVLLCPINCKYTVSRKPICPEDVLIEPSCGIFESHSSTIFTVSVGLYNLSPARYRATLHLIIEDLPSAAVPKKYNFSYQDSQVKRRLCSNSVDITFESIEVRLTCADLNKNSMNSENDKVENILWSTLFTDETLLQSEKSEIDFLESSSSSSDSSSDEVCRFIKGYGTCDCCRMVVNSNAVLRPESALFVGIEHAFSVNLTNASAKRLKYWWGNVFGDDHEKMKVQVEPRFDYLRPNSSDVIKIKCLPLETGNISSIFIPCQYDGMSSSIFLSIECTVKALCVVFYYPLTNEKNIRVEWTAEEYVSKYDKKTDKIKLFRPKLKEEKLLHLSIYNLSQFSNDEQRSFRENSGYGSTREDEGTSSIFERASSLVLNVDLECNRNTNDRISIDYSLKSWIGEDEYDDEANKKLLPYFDFDANMMKQQFRYLPFIVEFHVVPGTSVTRRFYLQNESPISSYFRIRTKYLWKEGKDGLQQPSFDDSQELMSGLSLSIEPVEHEIKPYEIIYFDITAKSNTWGTYTDEVIINIDLLPVRSFWIKIINDSSPISYPLCKNTVSTIPRIRFKIGKHGSHTAARKVLVENTSEIPLYINWHCFLANQTDESKPFNVIVDMLTPFMSIDEFLSTNSNFYNAVKRFFSCAFNPYESNQNAVDTSYSSSNTRDSNIDHMTINNRNNDSVNYGLPSDSEIKINKVKDTEFQLSIVPYYGELRHDIFIIQPHELFLRPKQKSYVSISVNSEKLDPLADEISCRACGFIRIPPLFKYKDNVYFRKDGYYLPPTEIHLECVIKKSTLFVQSSVEQRTFEFHVKDFIQRPTNEIEIIKKVLLLNKNDEIVKAAFEISKPFRLTRISTQREIFCKNQGSLHPNDSVEITIKCKIDKNWMNNFFTEEGETQSSKCIIREEHMLIKYEGFIEHTVLFLKFNLPSLQVSTNYLDFGMVHIGESKLLSFQIQNLSDHPQECEIKQTDVNQVISFYPSKALLASKRMENVNVLQVIVKFLPKKPGFFQETFQIISEIDGLIAHCHVNGSACI